MKALQMKENNNYNNIKMLSVRKSNRRPKNRRSMDSLKLLYL